MFVVFVAHWPTNICSHFLQMKLIKEKTAHVLLISTRMDIIMVLPTTNLQPDIDNLASNTRPQKIALY